jgi:glycosyltransferase involved in cell wall biosynthesis
MLAAMRVSAVIPCFNGEPFLAEALESVHNQTHAVDELIVVDDGSTDRSVEIAESFGASVIRQEHGGEAAARNRGTAVATGDVIAWLDADDRWLPHHVAVLTGLLRRHREPVAALGAVQRFGSRDELIRGYVPPGGPRAVLFEAFRDWLHTTIGAVVRRSALLEIGGLDETERYAVDFDLWLRLARRHVFVATHEVTAEWRWHPAQQSSARPAQIATTYRFRRRFIDAMREDGDLDLAAALEAELATVWTSAVRQAVRERDGDVLAALRESGQLVTALTGRDRLVHGLATRAPELALHLRRLMRAAPAAARRPSRTRPEAGSDRQA